MTIPLKNLGTFFTTIVILIPPYLENSMQRPPRAIAQPIIKSHPDNGSNSTSKTPNPKPMRQVASNFFSILHMLYLLCNIICKLEKNCSKLFPKIFFYDIIVMQL